MTDFHMPSIAAALIALRGAAARGSTLRLTGEADDLTWAAVVGFPGGRDELGVARLELPGLTVALTLAPEPLGARPSVEPAAYGLTGPAEASGPLAILEPLSDAQVDT